MALSRVFGHRPLGWASFITQDLVGSAGGLVNDDFFETIAFEPISTISLLKIPLSLLLLDGYSGSPWLSSPSGGDSGSSRSFFEVTNPPTTAPALNTRVGAFFSSGTGKRLTGQGGTGFADTWVTPTDGYIALVVEPFNNPADPGLGSRYQFGFIGDSGGNFGISYSAYTYTAFMYDGSGPGWNNDVRVRAPAVTQVHFVEMWWTAGYLHLRVNGQEGVAQPINPTWMATYLSGLDFKLGDVGNGGATPFQGWIYAVAAAQTALGQNVRDALGRSFSSRYGVPFALTASDINNMPHLYPNASPWTLVAEASFTFGGSFDQQASRIGPARAGGFSPTTGASLNGYSSADFHSGAADLIVDTYDTLDLLIGTAYGATAGISYLVDQFTISGVIAIDSASATLGGDGYQDCALFTDDTNAYCFISVTTSGIRLGLYHPGLTVWKTITKSFPQDGVARVFHAWYDGVNLNLTVAGVAATPVQSTPFDYLLTGGLMGLPKFGINYNSTSPVFDGRMWAFRVSNRNIGTIGRAALDAYWTTKYFGGGAYTLTTSTGVFSALFKNNAMLRGRRMPTTVGAFTDTHNAANFLRGRRMPTTVGSFALAGIAAGLLRGERMPTTVGVFSMLGNGAALSVQRKIAAALGTFALTGSAAGLLAQRRLVAAVRSYALAGGAAGLLAGRKIPIVVGAFALSGSSASLLRGRVMPTTVGAFALVGNGASLTVQRRLAAGVGAFSLVGLAAGLLTPRKLSAAVGAFALTGSSAGMAAAHRLVAAQVAFALTGNAAVLTRIRKLLALPGTFSLAGSSAGLSATRRLTAVVGSYALTGNAAAFAAAHRMPTSTGAFALAGTAAQLSGAHRLACSSVAFALSGGATGLRATKRMPTSAGVFLLVGVNVQLFGGATLYAATGAYAVTGGAAGFLRTRRMPVTAGVFSLVGSDAGFGVRMPASAGVFGVSSSPVVLTAQRRLSATAGAFAVTGTVVRFHMRMRAIAASYALSGGAAAFQRARVMPASAGAFALVGKTVGLGVKRGITAQTASFGVAGGDVRFVRSIRFAVEAGDFVWFGGAALFSRADASPTIRMQTIGPWVTFGIGAVDAAVQIALYRPAPLAFEGGQESGMIVGNVAKLDIDIKKDGVLIDPLVVRIVVQSPSQRVAGTSTIYTFGLAAEVVQRLDGAGAPMAGKYRALIPGTEAGKWSFIWDTDPSGGPDKGSRDGYYDVEPRPI